MEVPRTCKCCRIVARRAGTSGGHRVLRDTGVQAYGSETATAANTEAPSRYCLCNRSSVVGLYQLGRSAEGGGCRLGAWGGGWVGVAWLGGCSGFSGASGGAYRQGAGGGGGGLAVSISRGESVGVVRVLGRGGHRGGAAARLVAVK
jgi:hypothetical protein